MNENKKHNNMNNNANATDANVITENNIENNASANKTNMNKSEQPNADMLDITQLADRSEDELKLILSQFLCDKYVDITDIDSASQQTILNDIKSELNYYWRDIVNTISRIAVDNTLDTLLSTISSKITSRDDYLINTIIELVKQNKILREKNDMQSAQIRSLQQQKNVQNDRNTSQDIMMSPLLFSRIINYLSAYNDGTAEYRNLMHELNTFAQSQVKKSAQNNTSCYHTKPYFKNNDSKCCCSAAYASDDSSCKKSQSSAKCKSSTNYKSYDFSSADDIYDFISSLSEDEFTCFTNKDFISFLNIMRRLFK